MTGSRALVISPHLDDAVFSIGAGIASLCRHGVAVAVLTVLAGDPTAETSAGPWDSRAGFPTAGAAARARRDEDARACRVVGAEPCWLPFADEQYERADPDVIWSSVEPYAERAGRVLIPGYPLNHADHRWLNELLLARLDRARVELYAEQPYAAWTGRPPPSRLDLGIGGQPIEWRPMPASPHDRWTKLRACRAYRSQLGLFEPKAPLLAWRVARYESRLGGELVAPVSSTNVHR